MRGQGAGGIEHMPHTDCFQVRLEGAAGVFRPMVFKHVCRSVDTDPAGQLAPAILPLRNPYVHRRAGQKIASDGQHGYQAHPHSFEFEAWRMDADLPEMHVAGDRRHTGGLGRGA